MVTVYSEKVVDKLLFEPIHKGANHLCILALRATPSMASWLITTYAERHLGNIAIELIVENTAENGINSVLHQGFKELQISSSMQLQKSFSCSYLYQPPATEENYYIWFRDEMPIQAISCSYDFTQASLLRNNTGGFTARAVPYAYSLYEKIIGRTIYCNHSEVEDYIVIHSSNSAYAVTNSEQTENSVLLPLITKRTGEPGTKSGLNWGQRTKRNKNEAYIPLPHTIAKSGFFPLNKQHFLAVTDDHHTLQLRVEQQNDKAITTPASNALLGEYFRNRLGLANGAYVHLDDLISYGRTDVLFCKIDEEQYYMDFSVNERKK